MSAAEPREASGDLARVRLVAIESDKFEWLRLIADY